MTGRESPLSVFQCDEAVLSLPEVTDEHTRVHRILSRGSSSEIDLQMHELYRIVLDRVSNRHADLVRIAAYVYRADTSVSRGGDRDSDSKKWNRRLHLCIPVTDADFWNQRDVVAALSSALNVLTDDRWSFTFSASQAADDPIQLRIEAIDHYQETGAVVLFSGGLDSLCTLADTAIKGERPVPLSHWANPRLRPRQEELIRAWNHQHPQMALPLVGAPIVRRGTRPTDTSQRSRGFLYGCLASAVAAETGAPNVYFSDNGPISLNLPINDQLVGAMASRATHPLFLYRLNQFVQMVVASPVTISNPLQWKTRPEALETLKTARIEHLIPNTLSCSAGSRLPSATPHCGGCSQCVDRRIALIAAGLEVHDPVDRYHQDLFLDDLAPWDRAMTAYSYVRFARSVHTLQDREILERYPQLLDILIPSDPAPEQTLQDAVDMMRRHTSTIMRVMTDQISIHIDKLVTGTLSAGSLLGKIAGEQVGRRAPQATLKVVTDHHAQTTTALVGPQASPSQPTMVWSGNAWNISYGGHTVSIARTVNIARLAVLLREPDRLFSPEDIIAITEGRAIAHGENLGRDEARQTSSLVSDQPVVDRRTMLEARTKIRELSDQAARLRQAGDEDLAAETASQIETIDHYLRQGTGLHGRPRLFATENRQRYRTIRRSVERGIDLIGHHHRPLWNHLNQSIHLDQSFIYSPEPVVQWKVILPHQAA